MLFKSIRGIDISFLNALKTVENGIKSGWNGSKWLPHPSPEGGTDTIAYGHKLTPQERDSRVFHNGITELEALDLFMEDLNKKFNQIQGMWEKHQGSEFIYLPKKYQYVLLDLTYNVGIGNVATESKWKWPKLAKAIKTNNDQQVYEQSMRTYKTPAGKRVKLVSRTDQICKALGIKFS